MKKLGGKMPKIGRLKKPRMLKRMKLRRPRLTVGQALSE